MTELLQLAQANADLDLVILDSSPALVVTDPVVLAPHVDGVLLVVDEEKSKLRPIQRTVKRFGMVGAKVLGVVVNRFDPRAGGYGGYGHYYRTTDQGGDGDSGDADKHGDPSRLEPAAPGVEQPDVLTASRAASSGPQ